MGKTSTRIISFLTAMLVMATLWTASRSEAIADGGVGETTGFSAAAELFRFRGNNKVQNVRIMWNSISGASKYSISRVNAVSGVSTGIGQSAGNQFDDYSLPNGTFRYVVSARNSANKVVGVVTTNTVTPFTSSHVYKAWDNVSGKQISAADFDMKFTDAPKFSTSTADTTRKWKECTSESIKRHYPAWIQADWKKVGSDVEAVSRAYYSFNETINGVTTYSYCQVPASGQDSRVVTNTDGSVFRIANSSVSSAGMKINPITHHAILYAHLIGASDRAQFVVLEIDATAKVVHSFIGHPAGYDTNDLSMYVEKNSAYLVAAVHSNNDVAIIQLNSAWSEPTSKSIVLYKGECRETPHLVKIADKYYLLTSHTSWWEPSQTRYLVSNSLWGNWGSSQGLGDQSGYDAQFVGFSRAMSSTDDSDIDCPKAKRASYAMNLYHWGANRSPKTSLGNARRYIPVAVNGKYLAATWFSEVDMDSEYGFVPVLREKSLTQNNTYNSQAVSAIDSTFGLTPELIAGEDVSSSDSSFVKHNADESYSVTIDLRRQAEISEVDFSTPLIDRFYSWRIDDYHIETSRDGKTYSTVLSGKSKNLQEFYANRLNNVVARYVKIVIDHTFLSNESKQTYAYNGISSVNVYGTPHGGMSSDHTIAFNAQGGSAVPFQTVADGSKATVPASPSRKNYAFDGWHTGDGKAFNFNAPVTSDVQLYAKWKRASYSVVFDSAGGSAVPEQTVLPGNTVTKPTDPTRKGYTFYAWYTQDGKWKFDFKHTKVNSDLTLVAHWKAGESPSKPVAHRVSFDAAGGSAVASQSVRDGGRASRPADPSRAGYVFDGWYKGNSKYDFDAPVKADVRLTARWTATVAMSRLYNPNTGEHFYTGNTKERDALRRVGWRYEGTGWVAPAKSGKPVYRLYNPYVPGGDHHYTMSADERKALVRAGWRYEGVGWYSAENDGRKPLYREYNPYAVTGTHNYTLSRSEHEHLVRLGWRGEGMAWYAVSDKTK